MKSKIKSILTDVLDLSSDLDIPSNFKFKDCDVYDSLSETILISELNEQFDVVIDYQKFHNEINTFDDIFQYISMLNNG